MDGNGLLGGCLKDLTISKFLKDNVTSYLKKPILVNQILNFVDKVSLKNINGSSNCALNWSKNSAESS